MNIAVDNLICLPVQKCTKMFILCEKLILVLSRKITSWLTVS